jgi:hypothetical protein
LFYVWPLSPTHHDHLLRQAVRCSRELLCSPLNPGLSLRLLFFLSTCSPKCFSCVICTDLFFQRCMISKKKMFECVLRRSMCSGKVFFGRRCRIDAYVGFHGILRIFVRSEFYFFSPREKGIDC